MTARSATSHPRSTLVGSFIHAALRRPVDLFRPLQRSCSLVGHRFSGGWIAVNTRFASNGLSPFQRASRANGFSRTTARGILLALLLIFSPAAPAQPIDYLVSIPDPQTQTLSAR